MKSGVHATLAGDAVDMLLVRDGAESRWSELSTCSSRGSVSYRTDLYVCQCGCAAWGISLSTLSSPTPWRIAVLFLGKQMGVFGAVTLAFKLRMGKPPAYFARPTIRPRCPDGGRIHVLHRNCRV
ncbi:hypothetical protein IVB48_33710 [Bradyrhizobium sp. 76]|nr:hypothetical protein [Bradyrhizobium sp. 76]